MDEYEKIDTFIGGERYISRDVFMGNYAASGDLYQGYIIGEGYVSITQERVDPIHLNGQSPETRRVPYNESSFSVVSKMTLDRSPEMVMKSLRGLFENGKSTTITVKSGMTLSGIASLFGITVDDLVRCNNIDNPDKIAVGQKIVVPAPSTPPKYLQSEEENFLFSTEMGLISMGLTALSAGLSIYTEVPLYHRMAASLKGNYFLARYKGEIVVWSNGYYGGPTVSSDFVKAQKLAYLSQVNKLKWVKWGGQGASYAGIGLSILQFYIADKEEQRIKAGFDIFMGGIGLTPIGWSTGALYSLSSPLRDMWQEKVLPVQMEAGIEGCASVMPFK